METLIECVPNFSEGRRTDVVEEIESAIGSVPEIHLLGRHMDPSHNRSVITFIASPDTLAEGILKGAQVAQKRIDLRLHKGEHPRMGALDVCPLIPLRGADEALCLQISEEVARRLWEELQIPVYFYEASARYPSRKNLAAIRNLGFEHLSEASLKDSNFCPDVGGPKLHKTAGATAVGVRSPLVAFNVNLTTKDVSVAQKIAHAIRERDGGLKGVKALGFFIREQEATQVSMNLTDLNATGLHRAYEAVKLEASRFGVGIQESEIVGLVPQSALFDAAAWELQLHRFSRDAVLENRIRAILEDADDLESTQPLQLAQSAHQTTSKTSENAAPKSGIVQCLQAAMTSALWGCDLFLSTGKDMGFSEDAQKTVLVISEAKAGILALEKMLNSAGCSPSDLLATAQSAMEHVADALEAGLALGKKANKDHGVQLGTGVLELSTALSSLCLAIEGLLKAEKILGRAKNQQRRQMNANLERGRQAATAMEVTLQTLFAD